MYAKRLGKIALTVLAVGLLCASTARAGLSRQIQRALKNAKPLTLNELERNPSGFLGQTVAFDCFFAQSGGLYRPFYTPFIREHYVNFWVWRLDARLWEPEERQDAFFFCFVDRKNTDALKVVQNLKPFSPIKVIGKVEMVSEGKPWLDVFNVARADVPSYTEKAIKHISVAKVQLDKGEFDFASKLFERALREDLPVEARKRVYRDIGMAYYELGKYDYAEKNLLAAESLIAELDPKLMLRLGQSKLNVGERTGDKRRLESAVEYLKKSVDQEPNLAEGHADLGLAYGLLGNHTVGLYSIRTALKLEPQNARAFRNRAVIYRMKNELEEAIRWLQQAILAKPNDPQYHRELGDIYMEVGRYTDAETEFRNFITLDQRNPEAYYLRATARLAQETAEGRKDAIDDLNASIEFERNFKPSYLLLAKAYMFDDRWEESADTLRKAAKTFTDDVDIKIRLVTILKQHGLWDECAQVLDDAVKVAPANMDLKFQLAQMLADKPEPERAKAVAVLEEMLRARHDTPELRFLLGRLYVETSKPSQALTHLNKYLKDNPQDVQALLFRGAAYAQGGVFRFANMDNDAVLKIDPSNPFAANNKAYLMCLTQQTTDKAEELASAAYRAKPSSPTFAGTLSWALSLNDRFQDAKGLATEVVARGDTADGYYYLALSEFGLGEIDDAQRDVKKALELTKALPRTKDNVMFTQRMRELDTKVRTALTKREADLKRQRDLERRRSRSRPSSSRESAPPVVSPIPE